VETDEIPDNLLDVSAGPQYSSLRHLIADEAERRLGEFLSETRDCGVEMTSSLAWGRPAEAIVRTASELQADLIAIGTVGRSGLEGLFLGNTAESVLTASDCNVLAVKPAGFLTPVEPTGQQLHP
jgi:nucleotide-binding universal stress UspA family protein